MDWHLLGPRSGLTAHGPDAFTFLQSQCSQDLRPLAAGGPPTYGLWLDRRGKVRADSLVWRDGPAAFRLLPLGPGEPLLTLLEANLVADEVELAPWAAALAWREGPPAAPDAFPHPGPGAGALRLAGEGETLPDGRAAYAAWRVEAGCPLPGVDFPGGLPQEGGVESWAVSFNKGCYLGQEVMARLHGGGHATRRLWRARLAGGPAPTAGAALFAGPAEAGRLGTVAGDAALALVRDRLAAPGLALAAAPDAAALLTLLAPLASA